MKLINNQDKKLLDGCEVANSNLPPSPTNLFLSLKGRFSIFGQGKKKNIYMGKFFLELG